MNYRSGRPSLKLNRFSLGGMGERNALEATKRTCVSRQNAARSSTFLYCIDPMEDAPIRKLARAVSRVNPPPCDNCKWSKACRFSSLSCHAFGLYLDGKDFSDGIMIPGRAYYAAQHKPPADEILK